MDKIQEGFPLNIETMLSGFLFLFIIITNITSGRFGNETFSDLDAETKMQKISKDPKKFQIGIILILIEHISIILLAVMLFIAFNQYNIILAIVWTIFRIGESLIQIYNKKSKNEYENQVLKTADKFVSLGILTSFRKDW